MGFTWALTRPSATLSQRERGCICFGHPLPEGEGLYLITGTGSWGMCVGATGGRPLKFGWSDRPSGPYGGAVTWGRSS